MQDGARIETVLLTYRERHAVCVSTQVGCACGCRFCATGDMGFVRQLSSDEIIAQVDHFLDILAPTGTTVSNVVLMGMGEPLLNEEQSLKAVQRLIDPREFGFAPSRVTLSTVGIAPGIVKLADMHAHLPIRLAVSLHAATDDLRTSLMPINITYPLDALFEAIRYYTDRTGRRVLYEWIMIDRVNDTIEQAEALSSRLAGLPAHVNLIQLNPTEGFDGRPSRVESLTRFTEILDRYGIPHTMRQRRGGGIDAGCGQLRTRHQASRLDNGEDNQQGEGSC